MSENILSEINVKTEILKMFCAASKRPNGEKYDIDENAFSDMDIRGWRHFLLQQLGRI